MDCTGTWAMLKVPISECCLFTRGAPSPAISCLRWKKAWQKSSKIHHRWGEKYALFRVNIALSRLLKCILAKQQNRGRGRGEGDINEKGRGRGGGRLSPPHQENVGRQGGRINTTKRPWQMRSDFAVLTYGPLRGSVACFHKLFRKTKLSAVRTWRQ